MKEIYKFKFISSDKCLGKIAEVLEARLQPHSEVRTNRKTLLIPILRRVCIEESP